MSYGILGNEDIPPFRYLSGINIGGEQLNYPFGSSLSQVVSVGAIATSVGNENIKWEQTATFDAGIDFQGVYGNEIYRYWGSSELPFTRFNYPTFRLDRWTGAGTSNFEPAVSSRPINRLPSTYGVEDGSFFRIRNLQVGYNLNADALRKVNIKSFRIFANVQNLKTWKRNSGYSPEFGGSPTQFGIDDGNGPIPVIYTAGINVNF
mgnify:CR=1 FL=1